MFNKIQIRKINKKILFSIYVPVLVYIFLILTTDITYTTTDDVTLMQILAGYKNGIPMGWTQFTGPLLAKFISSLYKLYPGMNWYVCLQHFLIIFSIIIINICVWSLLDKYISGKINSCIGAITSLGLNGILSWTIVRMHFYYVCIATGCAVISIVLTVDVKKKRSYLLMALFFMFFCSGYSMDATYAIGCYLALAILYRVISESGSHNERKDILVQAMILLVSIASLLLFTRVSFISERDRLCGNEYSEWNKYRVSYWDYPIVSYEDDPLLYEDIGWNEDFYRLTRKIYFMDDRFNVEQLDHIVTPFSRTSIPIDIQSIKNAYKRLRDLVLTDEEVKGQLILLCGLFLAYFPFVKRWGKEKYKIAGALCSIMGSGILCTYLSLRGRIPQRAFSVIVIPSIFFLIINYISLCGEYLQEIGVVDEHKQINVVFIPKRLSDLKGRKYKSLIEVGISLAFVVLSYCMFFNCTARYLNAKGTIQYYKREKQRESMVYDYVRGNKDKIIVYDWSSIHTYNPKTSLKMGDLTNLFCWGGSSYRTYPYNEQLRYNGLNELKSQDFERENVYFISNSTESISLLSSFLSSEYSIDQCYVADILDEGFVVLKFASSAKEYSEDFQLYVSGLEVLSKRILNEIDAITRSHRASITRSGMYETEGINPGEELVITIHFVAFSQFPSFVFTPLCDYGYGGYLIGHVQGVGYDWATIVVKNTSDIWLPLTINWIASGS